MSWKVALKNGNNQVLCLPPTDLKGFIEIYTTLGKKLEDIATLIDPDGNEYSAADLKGMT